MMHCPNCGMSMLNGFKFCHHCGHTISVAAAAPELIVPTTPVQDPEPIPTPDAETITETEEFSSTPELAPLESLPIEEDMYVEDPQPRITVGGMYLFELFCKIPILNFFILAIIASSGRESPMREISRAKLLAMLTVAVILILAALVVVLLMHLNILEPIYLGNWN